MHKKIIKMKYQSIKIKTWVRVDKKLLSKLHNFKCEFIILNYLKFIIIIFNFINILICILSNIFRFPNFSWKKKKILDTAINL